MTFVMERLSIFGRAFTELFDEDLPRRRSVSEEPRHWFSGEQSKANLPIQ
jgi:hypothetical protein